ncbi:ATP-binding cassette domain-containing protein [Marinobacterium sedimentorum]|uniref:ATP-binding cassette domain-containing protein n=1 Tax=Marinobacterium sedimentorum TaxID=2927804 RepID=UPI0020C637A0|nr:ATP-binding cassette domain-containing protein [Marinobacterium sedimentorum]MCP8686757.1 ATP-binding cassette domain-containing protein [Marinobacterium sedimentorum]
MLDIEDLQVLRDRQPLRYSLQVHRGEILAIQGRSGVGKTTLLDCIAGFATATAGRLDWQGHSLLGLSAAQRPVSMLFQDHNLFEHLSVADNLQLGLSVTLPQDRLQEALDSLEVAGLLTRRPTELSGGQRQRIALIRTLLRPEPIVLLDEPFAELDPHSRQCATDWTRRTAKAAQKTLLMVTHQDEDVQQVADRAIVLQRPA